MVNIEALPDDATTPRESGSNSLLKQASRSASRVPTKRAKKDTLLDSKRRSNPKGKSNQRESPKSVRFLDTREPDNPRERHQVRGDREANDSFSEESSDEEYWETVEYRQKKPRRGLFGRLFHPPEERVVVKRKRASGRRKLSSFSSDESDDYTRTSDEYSEQTEQTDQTPQSLDVVPSSRLRRSDRRRRYFDEEEYDSAEDSADSKDVKNACSEVMYDTLLMWTEPPPPPKKPLLLKAPPKKPKRAKNEKPKTDEEAVLEVLNDTLFMWADPPRPKGSLCIEGSRKARDEIEDNRSYTSGYSERSMISWQRHGIGSTSGPSKAACRSALEQLQKKKRIIQPPSFQHKNRGIIEPPSLRNKTVEATSPMQIDSSSEASLPEEFKEEARLPRSPEINNCSETDALGEPCASDISTDRPDPPTAKPRELSEDMSHSMRSTSEQSTRTYDKTTPSLDIPLAAKIPMALAGIAMDRDERKDDYLNLDTSTPSFDKCGKTVYNLYMTQINDPSLKKVADELTYLRSLLKTPPKVPASAMKLWDATKKDPPAAEAQGVSQRPDPAGLLYSAMSELELSIASQASQISVGGSLPSTGPLKLESCDSPLPASGFTTEDGLPSWYTRSQSFIAPSLSQKSMEDGLPSWYTKSESLIEPATSQMSTEDGLHSWYTKSESLVAALSMQTSNEGRFQRSHTVSEPSTALAPSQKSLGDGLPNNRNEQAYAPTPSTQRPDEGGCNEATLFSRLITETERGISIKQTMDNDEAPGSDGCEVGAVPGVQSISTGGHTSSSGNTQTHGRNIEDSKLDPSQKEAITDLMSRMRTKHRSSVARDSEVTLATKTLLESNDLSKGSASFGATPVSAVRDASARKETKSVPIGRSMFYTNETSDTSADEEAKSAKRSSSEAVKSEKRSSLKNVRFSRSPMVFGEDQKKTPSGFLSPSNTVEARSATSYDTTCRTSRTVDSKQIAAAPKTNSRNGNRNESLSLTPTQLAMNIAKQSTRTEKVDPVRSLSNVSEAKRTALDEIQARIAPAAEVKRSTVSERRQRLDDAKARSAAASASVRASLEARRRKRREAEAQLMDSVATLLTSLPAHHHEPLAAADKGGVSSPAENREQSTGGTRGKDDQPKITSSTTRSLITRTRAHTMQVDSTGKTMSKKASSAFNGHKERPCSVLDTSPTGTAKMEEENDTLSAMVSGKEESGELGAVARHAAPTHSTRRHGKIIDLLQDIETHINADAARIASKPLVNAEVPIHNTIGINLTLSDIEASEDRGHEDLQRAPVLPTPARMSKETNRSKPAVKSKTRSMARPCPESVPRRRSAGRQAGPAARQHQRNMRPYQQTDKLSDSSTS